MSLQRKHCWRCLVGPASDEENRSIDTEMIITRVMVRNYEKEEQTNVEFPVRVAPWGDSGGISPSAAAPKAAPLPVLPPPERPPEARAAARKAAGLLLPSPSSSLGSSASMAVVAGSGAPRPVPPPGRPDPRPTPPDPCPSPPDLPPRASARRGAAAAVPAWRGAVATPAAACEAAVVAPFGAGPHRGAAAAAPAAVWGRRRWRHRRPVRGGAGGTGVQCAAATPAAACVP